MCYFLGVSACQWRNRASPYPDPAKSGLSGAVNFPGEAEQQVLGQWKGLVGDFGLSKCIAPQPRRHEEDTQKASPAPYELQKDKE